MKPWSAWVKLMAVHLQDCPEPTIAAEVRRAAREFFADSRAWRIDGFALAATVAGQRDYAVTGLPDGAELVGLPAVWVGTEEADETPAGHVDDVDRITPAAVPTWAVAGPAMVRATPAPSTSDAAVSATIALRPSEAADGIPDALFDAHHAVIRDRALAALKLMAGKPWYDAGGALMFKAEAQKDALRASSCAGPLHRRAPLRVRPL